MNEIDEKLLRETDEAEQRFESGKDNARAFKKRMRHLGYSTEYIQHRLEALSSDWSD